MLPGQLRPCQSLAGGFWMAAGLFSRGQSAPLTFPNPRAGPAAGLPTAIPRDPAGAESRHAGSEWLQGLYQTSMAPGYLQASFSDDKLIKITAESRDTRCWALLPRGELCATAVSGLKTNPRACVGASCRRSVNKPLLTMQMEACQLLAWGWKTAKNGWVC